MSGPALLERYRCMLLMRRFDELCLEGVRSGEIHGEMHLGIGQEGVAAGMLGSLRHDDACVSTHRAHFHAIAKGVPLIPLLAEIFERETGLCRGRGGHMHLFDPDRNFSTSGIVGASLPVALGYAYAYSLARDDRVAVGITGDGGVNTGAFHETMNIAGAWRLPLVVLVENNRWAISVPFESASATETIAERASVYRAWGKRVDGTDVEAMAAAFAEAVEHARRRRGPALLEATCYRFRGHYEGDPDHYRSPAEKEEMLLHDPIAIAGQRLVDRGGATPDDLDRLAAEVRRELDAVLAEVRAAPMPDPAGAAAYLYAETTPR